MSSSSLTVNDVTIIPDKLPAPPITSKFFLLQAYTPLTDVQAYQLLQKNIEVQSLVNRDSGELPAYLCKHDQDGAHAGAGSSITNSSAASPDLKTLETLPFVKKVIGYPTAAVISPLLADPTMWTSGLPFVKHHPKYGDLVIVDILLHANTEMTGDDVFHELKTQATARDKIILKYNASSVTLTAIMSAGLVSEAAKLEDVASVQPYWMAEAPCTLRARRMIGLPAWDFDKEAPSAKVAVRTFTGKDQVVFLVEPGFDNGLIDTEKIHPAFRNDGKTETRIIDFPKTNCSIEIPYEHGVGVAGCITGRYFAPRQWVDTAGSCGMAPDAKLYIQSPLAPPRQNDPGRIKGVVSPKPALPLPSSSSPPPPPPGISIPGFAENVGTLLAESDAMGPARVDASTTQDRPVRATSATAASNAMLGPTITIQDQVERMMTACKELEIDAVIQNNSWGMQPSLNEGRTEDLPVAFVPYIQVPYDAHAAQVDEVLHRNPNLLLVFAAGNLGDHRHRKEGDDPAKSTFGFNRQINGPAAAKNALTVGAAIGGRRAKAVWPSKGMNYNPEVCVENRAEEIKSPLDPRELELGVADFSSKGPTWEGLLKPDIVAPGAAILSAGLSGDQPASADRPWPNLAYHSGASIATGIVSGLAACLREAAYSRQGQQMPGLLLKAIIVNGAVSLKGLSIWITDYGEKTPYSEEARRPADPTTDPRRWKRMDIGDPPDCVQGYGQVSYPRSVKHILSYNFQPTMGGAKLPPQAVSAPQQQKGALQAILLSKPGQPTNTTAPDLSPPTGHTGYLKGGLPCIVHSELKISFLAGSTSPSADPRSAPQEIFRHEFQLDWNLPNLSVTFAYNDEHAHGLVHDLNMSLTVCDQNRKEIDTLWPRPVQTYPYDGHDRSNERDKTDPKLKPARLGTVRKIIWSSSTLPRPPPPGVPLFAVAQIWQIETGLRRSDVPFALAWLSEDDDELKKARLDIETVGGLGGLDSKGNMIDRSTAVDPSHQPAVMPPRPSAATVPKRT